MCPPAIAARNWEATLIQDARTAPCGVASAKVSASTGGITPAATTSPTTTSRAAQIRRERRQRLKLTVTITSNFAYVNADPRARPARPTAFPPSPRFRLQILPTSRPPLRDLRSLEGGGNFSIDLRPQIREDFGEDDTQQKHRHTSGRFVPPFGWTGPRTRCKT